MCLKLVCVCSDVFGVFFSMYIVFIFVFCLSCVLFYVVYRVCFCVMLRGVWFGVSGILLVVWIAVIFVKFWFIILFCFFPRGGFCSVL